MAQGGERRTTPTKLAHPRNDPRPASPELQRFIDAVIVPALLDRLLREHESAA
jgi:hypothetical protein